MADRPETHLVTHVKKGAEASSPAEASHRHHKHHMETHGRNDDIDKDTAVKDVKGPSVFQRAKEEIEAIAEAIHIHPKKDSPDKHHHMHDTETHGRNDDIDEGTAIEDVKGPGVFERAKEEIEALVEAIHSKKDSSDASK